MRNSSLVEDSSADNYRESRFVPNLWTRKSGRGAFLSAMKLHRQGGVERQEVNMSASVTINGVRISVAESLRFPGEGKSAQG